ncbi:MAG: hypothetical protein IPO46_09525 [Chitinophagaceae bacterium]|jgi:hypothetical protein|nr:hypothetical protein [Chitinophagaceae bacterium]MBP8993795.1 hypothetical protein [Bacteroidales bacterium]MBK7088436.1 hypothetical protein [Chitinophagaceae bacterium]MBK8775779.1 hypothetical protein [Chitinophagaceae bacterium]MBK8930167.1 hypothetical protein [Chitinophagaceae bacterium]
MKLDDKKKKYIEKEAFNILALIEETEEKSKVARPDTGSSNQKIPFDLTDKLVNSPIIISQTDFESVISKKQCFNGKCIGLNIENYKRLVKLNDTIHKEKSINQVISKEFIEDKIFDWLISTFKNKKADKSFANFLMDELENSLKAIKYHFPTLYLDINKPFEIGKVSFNFFTKEYFNYLEEHYKKKDPEKYRDDFSEFRKKYQGMVYVAYSVKAESSRGEEIAFEKCSLAVDVLKMCSETTDFPNVELGFDIDRRVNINPQNEVFVCNAENELDDLKLNLSRPKHHHKIDDKEWERIISRQAPDFHNFLLQIETCELSELQQLIINSIKRYGNAISNKNLHQRIVELFTILESLLLLDQNSPIIDSVCKYCSKLVFKKVEDRKYLIALLKSMYEVRSSLIHHGKEKKIELTHLRQLQYSVVMLLSTLITKTDQHKTKQSVLNEIEEAILNAY